MTDPQQPSYGFPPAPPTAPAAPEPTGADVYPGAPAFPAPSAAGAFLQPSGAYAAPAGAYQVPAGGYTTPTAGYVVPTAPEKRPAVFGIVALALALAAAVVAPIIGGIMAWEIGFRLPEIANQLSDDSSLAFLSPVREQVLWAEVSFWAGTVAGIAAIVLGIMAIVQRRGRGQGIAATIIAVAAAIIYAVVVFIALFAGAGAGFVA